MLAADCCVGVSFDAPVEGEEVEEEGAVGLGRERHHLPPPPPQHSYSQQHSPFGGDVGESCVKVTRSRLSWISADWCSIASSFWSYQ